jgi:hypothetical protein
MGLHGLTPYEKLKGLLGDNNLPLDKISNFGYLKCKRGSIKDEFRKILDSLREQGIIQVCGREK